MGLLQLAVDTVGIIRSLPNSFSSEHRNPMKFGADSVSLECNESFQREWFFNNDRTVS